MRKSKLFFSLLVLSFGLLSGFAARAMADDDDPPGRVARLNYIQGSISFQPSGESDWVQANPNRPMTVGDNLWADRNSRGELHVGSTSIRIGSETGITFLNLDDRTVQIQLAQGSLYLHVRHMEGGDDFEVDTPNLAFTLERAGEYRVDVDPNGNATAITVRQGEGDATGGGSEYHMDSGDQATFSGSDQLIYDGGQGERRDDFDDWCQSRDDREERAQSARYVSRDVIGYDDLDDHGEWRNVPDYGYVWFPAGVAAGWAPYRFGHWVWISPWGWTWVEDEPWGFAPFHYGRWAVFGGSWCWVPGPVVVRPVYAPALVVFVGGSRFNAAVSFGGGGGGMAWFPLGPREVYVPPYRTSVRYVQNVNVTNTTVNVVNVTNVYNNVTVNNTTVNKITYVHQNNAAAITAVSHDTFVNARPVAAAAVRVNPQQIQAAEVQRNVAVRPVQMSVVGAAPPAAVKPPQAVMQRQVVAKQTPAVQHAPVYIPPQKAMTQQQVRGLAPQAQQRQQQSQPQSQPQQQMQSHQQQPQSQPQPQVQSRPEQTRIQQPPVQSQQQPQPQNQSRQQQPPAQQQSRPTTVFEEQGSPRQQSPQPQAARPAPQQTMRQQNPPPAQQQPNVRYAPPPQATEQTYHPHQFEKPQAAPAQNQRPAPQQERAAPPPQERPQPKGQEQNKSNGEEERKQR